VQKREAAEQRNELYKRRKPLQDKIDNFEKKLDTLHTEQEELCMHLADPDLAQPQIIEYNKRLAVIKAEIDQISKKWLTVADALEEIEAKFGD
jgi:uncharacterized coiled-coil DUF342 family protein